MKLSFFIERLQEYAVKDPEAKVGLLLSVPKGMETAYIGGMQLVEGFRDDGEHDSVLILGDRETLSRFERLDHETKRSASISLLDYFENVEQTEKTSTTRWEDGRVP